MNYKKGVEEGKKSQSPLWILSGFISIIEVFLVLLKNAKIQKLMVWEMNILKDTKRECDKTKMVVFHYWFCFIYVNFYCYR